MCVRGCQVRLQHLCCDVSHLITDTCSLLSPLHTANICVMHAWVWVCDRQTSAEVWQLMTALRPLMTPSILSPPTHADYPQRHLLTLYANDTERGSNEKRVTDKRGGQTRNGGGHEKQCRKEYVRKKKKWSNEVWQRKIRDREQKSGRVLEHTVWETRKTNTVSRMWKKKNEGD